MNQLTRLEVAAAVVAALGILPHCKALGTQAVGAKAMDASEMSASRTVGHTHCGSSKAPLCEGKGVGHEQEEGPAQSQEKDAQGKSKEADGKDQSKDKDASSKGRDAVCGVLDKQ